MKTDVLIDLLATGAGGVPQNAVGRRIGPAALIGMVGGWVLLVAIVGINPALLEFLALPGFWIKMAFTGALTVAGLLATVRLARPGVAVGNAAWLAMIPVLALWILAIVVLVDAEPAARAHLMLGDSWSVCPFNIALLSLPTLLAGLWALRGLAPTDQRLAGAALGLFSGALGACIYGLHCPELAPPFLSVWYVAGILIPTIVGLALGPRLLRW